MNSKMLGARWRGATRRGLLATLSLAAIAAASTARAADSDNPPTPAPGPLAANANAPETILGETPTVPAIVVTARRREENIDRVPLTVAAFTQADLTRQNVVLESDLMYVAPSLTIASIAFTFYTTYAIRGLSVGVTTYFSDAPGAGINSVPFMDVATVQVLDGPQGTLFGRSSAAGAVLINPVRPNFDSYGGLVDATVGDYSRAQFTGVVNIPIVADHVALRLAVNSNHVGGYTNVIGSAEKFDEENNQQYRATLGLRAGRFENYLVAEFQNVNQTPTSQVLSAINTSYPTFNLPASFAPALFGGVCATDVQYGFTSSIAACENQRYSTLANIIPELEAEYARVTSSPSAVRTAVGSVDGFPQGMWSQQVIVTDNLQYDFGNILDTQLIFRNIASFQGQRSEYCLPFDGIGGRILESCWGQTSQGLQGATNEINGNQTTSGLGPFHGTWTEEMRLQGDTDRGLLSWTVGGYWSRANTPQNLTETSDTYKLFGGVLNPDFGDSENGGFPAAGYATETAGYAQATLDLSKVGVHGLSVTGGYRKSWDYTREGAYAGVLTLPSGTYVPGALTSSSTSSSGYNYDFSIAEQVTPGLMIYGLTSRAYVPGGLNPFVGANTLPEFTQTFAPEIILDKEAGVKDDFAFWGMAGRIAVDAYWYQFSDITEGLSGLVGNTYTGYTENIAAASMHGIEVQGTLVPVKPLTITLSYNHNNARYTKWTGEDPYNVAQPGNPLCVPSSPAGFCFLNLTNNPFNYMPENQGHVTVRYDLPIDPALGELSLTATAYAQSRVWFSFAAARDLQLIPGDLNGVSEAPYAVFNLRLDWNNVKGSGWNAAVFADNVTNAIYASGNASDSESLGYSTNNYAPPRMIGLEISKKFGP